jgi:putative tryptophan/tyrosine transport system substrate-binding protein
MDRRALVIGLGAVLVMPRAAEAQQAGKVWRIGYLTLSPPERARYVLSLIEAGLRDFGYTPGKDVTIELYLANGDRDLLPVLARRLVDSRVDLILAQVNPEIAAAKQATTTIPIVMLNGVNPVGSGFVANLSRPGGNITGSAFDATPDSTAKNLQLLRELSPRVSRVAVLWDSSFPGIEHYMAAVKTLAGHLGMQIRPVAATRADEVPTALDSLSRDVDDAVLVFGSTLHGSTNLRVAIVNALNTKRLPAMYPYRNFVDNGGLMSYGTSLEGLWSRAPVFIDKILHGTKPADIPIEQPTKYELIINLKTAKALGLTIPQSLLLRADQVIE